MKYFIIIFWCFTLCGKVYAQDYNVLDYGAIKGGKVLNTSSIQAAIDAASLNGGGRVIIPEGTFLSGSIELRSGVDLHLQDGAVLLGSTNPADYRKGFRWNALILANKQESLKITGQGCIDGQGRELALHIDSLFYTGKIDSANYNFVEMRPKPYLRPLLIEFAECNRVKIENVTMKNASCWVQSYEICNNLTIKGIKVESDAYWNNDGIDVVDCRNVQISDCIINSSDDGICLKSHFQNYICDSVIIENCVVRSSASAIKFGTKSLGGFKNIIIKNIKVYDTFRSAIALESVDGGVLENVYVENVQALNSGNAIFLRIGKRINNRPPGILRNVTLKNIKVEVAFKRPDYSYDIRGPELPFFHNTFPSSITGIPEHPIENITLENIELIFPGRGNNGLANMPLSRLSAVPENEAKYPEFSMFGELPAWGFYIRHVKNITFKNVNLSIKAPDYRPAMVFDDVQHIGIQKMFIEGDNKHKHVILHNTANENIEDKNSILKLK